MKLNNQQLKLMEQQMKVDLFADYTKRYQEITLNLPEDINNVNFEIRKLKEDDLTLYNKTMRYMRIYFDLCSEQYFLNEKDLIEDYVWEEWSKGIKLTFDLKAFIDAWEIVNSDFYDDFAKWMRNDVFKS